MERHEGMLGTQSTTLAIVLVVSGIAPEVAWDVGLRTNEMFAGRTFANTMTFEELRTLAKEFGASP